jgi:hypothetical protein
MFAAGLSGFTQIEEDAGRAIDPVARRERRPNQPKQSGVLLSTIRDGLQEPVVITARGYLEDATHHLHAVLIAMCLDEFIGRADSPRDLVLGLWHRASAKPDAKRLSTKSWALSTSRRNILVTFQAETLEESRCRVDEETTPGD